MKLKKKIALSVIKRCHILTNVIFVSSNEDNLKWQQ